MIWFTSDNHFFHKSVIRMCNRPFDHLHHMHESMIFEWNKRVKPQEKVYVLGDFAFCGWTLMKTILSRLNGHKILVLGNHDLAAHKMLAAGFQEVHENHWIEIGNKQKVYLSHYPFHPMTAYAKQDDGSVAVHYPYEKIDKRYMHKRMVDDGESWLLHGHVHCAWRKNGRQINVGVDVWDFKPVSHEKILQLIEKGPVFDGKSKDDQGD